MISIRTAKDTDAAEVYEFICSLEDMKLNKLVFDAMYLSNLRNEQNIYLIAEEDSNAVGFLSCHGQALLHHANWVYEIQEVFVEAGYRSRGVGKALLAELEQRLAKLEYDMLEVTSNNKREQAHSFYECNGFMRSHQKFTRKKR